ncbi:MULTISPECIES: GNAT family N-acetyltransferase [Nocardiopsis]|uniref:GNAT family N-acetyltransferase n=1 Tax=Nocardiopsis sinuspersici TaxID=501010 RepID=A0A1V3C2M5_9ACTN|nr:MULTISPECIES: GNAT family N-acetyltransferase [Nocardiopsis]NYH51171.1 GNAT superfamily N-acetyltransferase [Nocardiopsis sinuspersici]OOC54943.1 GNAT family N-acetyltransferase [Nocardiopsis sinuspersici]
MHEWARRVTRDWPPFEVEERGGWRFGFAEGITKRANCALVMDPGADVSEVTAYYTGRGVRPCVQVWPGEEEVDRRLAGHGYAVVEPTLVLARDLGEPPEAPGTSSVSTAPGAAWSGLDLTRILGGVDAAYAAAGGGRGAAVLDGESVGVCAMFTEPGARGRGVATGILADLLRWSHDKGARRAYLCVVADNAPALRLYERAGFTRVSGYHNRVLG